MRGNAWQVTAIIAIILVVVLIVPLVIMGRAHQNLVEEAKGAKDALNKATRGESDAINENKALKALIGVPEATALDELRRQHAEITGKVLPGENDSTRTYHDTVTALLEDLGREKKERGTLGNNFAQTQSDLENERERFDNAVSKLNREKEDVETKRREQENQFLTAKRENDRKLQEAQSQQKLVLDKSERNRLELEDQRRQLENANNDIREDLAKRNAELEDIRNPNVEYPAGKIMSVDQLAGTAIVNIGRADGLLVRTMFSVYHSSVTGLAFRSAPVGKDAVYCDVCKREIARDVSKASVEVMRILGDHRAEVRILDDILSDPIMVGDIIYSPIWKPGQRMHFALGASVFLPNSGDDPGVEAMIRLIEMNGGIVDCWIDENAKVADGEEFLKWREGVSDLNLTNYIVVNETTNRIVDNEINRIQQALVEKGRSKDIKVIGLENLLVRMGWKNVTPVYAFGSSEFTPEMRVVPQRQGTLGQSSGAVSPAFTPDNTESRVNARDKNPPSVSPGVVTPLFDDKAPPPPASSGRTSDWFRPRSPVGGGN